MTRGWLKTSATARKRRTVKTTKEQDRPEYRPPRKRRK
jgi:hypothetical protein